MDFWRQIDVLNPKDIRTPITVVGAGGIGSPTALALVKMGAGNVTVYDDDTIENHNLPNQMYREGDLGKHKVVALAEICRAFSGTAIKAVPERLNGQRLSGVVISGVDSMESRSEIWERVKWNPRVETYIDARMGAEVCRIYTVNPCNTDDIEYYESTQYTDRNAHEAPCTARAIIYNTLIPHNAKQAAGEG